LTGGFADVGGEAAVVKLIECGEDAGGGDPVDGAQDAGWIIVPEVGLDLVEGRAFTFYDIEVFRNLGVVFLPEDRLVIEGHVDVEHPVMAAQFAGNAFTVAADIDVPGGKPDNDEVCSFFHVFPVG